MIPFTFRQLDYFIAIAEHGNISEAARARHIAQPAMSMAIAQLENLLGTKLFHRRPGHGLSLTPEGHRILAQSRALMALAQQIAGGRTADMPLEGRLAIACFKDLAPYILPRLMAAFRDRYPAISLHLVEADFAGVREALQAGRVELAITYELGMEADVQRLALAELPPYALLPADHPLARQAKVSLAALAQQPLILEDMAQSREYFMSLFWTQGLRPRISQYTQTFETQRGLVAHGHGVALSCTRPRGDRSYDGKRFVCRPLREKLAPQRVILAQLPDRPASPLAEAFRTWLEQWIRQQQAGKAPMITASDPA
jgi:DNA-binding transcriptional LysR family regulator